MTVASHSALIPKVSHDKYQAPPERRDFFFRRWTDTCPVLIHEFHKLFQLLAGYFLALFGLGLYREDSLSDLTNETQHTEVNTEQGHVLRILAGLNQEGILPHASGT